MNQAAVQEIIAKKPELKASKAKLEAMQPGAYCIHQSWGFGQIQSYDQTDGKLVINFEGKALHRMDPAFCINTMQVLPANHLLVRKQSEPEVIADIIANRQGELIVEILRQYPNGAASANEIETVLARVVGAVKHKKWWSATKKLLAKDPRISVPARKTGMYVLREEPVTLEEEVLEEYGSTQSAKRRVALAEKLLESAAEHPALKEQFDNVLQILAVAVKDSNQLSPAERLKGAWIRDDLAKILEVDVANYQPTIVELLADTDALDSIVNDLPTNLQTRALQAIKEAHPTEWKDISFSLLKNSSGKFTTDCINFLIENGFESDLKDTLNRWQTEQNLREPVLLWIVKNRHSRKYARIVQDMIHPRLLNSIFFAIDYEALQTASSRRIPLGDILSEDKDLIPDLLSTATSETARDLANNLLLNQGFEDLTKKSLLARFIKIFPGVQSLLESVQAEESRSLLVSRESYDKARSEYDDLVSKKIPENSKAIAEAREHGDLKENSEYKMAKQDQQVLLARRNMLEIDLQRAQIADFTVAPSDAIGIGSVATLVDEIEGKEVTYTILGAWDSDPDNQIISYQTPLGKILLGKKVGDHVTVKIESMENKLRVKSIERYVDLVKS